MKLLKFGLVAILTVFLAGSGALLSAQESTGRKIMLPAFTPLFAGPDHNSRALLITNQPVEAELLDTELKLTISHPLARYWCFSQVRLPGGETGYIEPQTYVGFDAGGKPTLKFSFETPWWRLAMMLAVSAGLVLTMLRLMRHFRGTAVLSGRGLACCLILLVVFIRQALLLTLIQGAGNIIANPMDDIGYFANLHSFLHRDFSEPWHFTVGQSILYLPFALLTGAENVTEIMVPFSYFSGFVMAPLSLAAGYLIARKLTSSDKIAFLSMLTWAVLPFFYHHPQWYGNAELEFGSYFGLPSFQFTFQHYINLIAGGFNAMSDVPSTLTILLCMTIVLYLKPRPCNYALLAFIFGFGCMLRINNILFLPLIGVLIWLYGRKELFKSCPYFLGTAALAAAAFVIGFLPQFMVNTYFYGNPLLFSYIRYSEGAHTSLGTWFFAITAGYYGATNHLVWVAGGVSIWFMRNRKIRTILCWWAIPVILFFVFYSHGTDDPIRFILTSFPAFFIAAAACEIWRGLGKYERFLPLVFAAAWLILGPNPTYGRLEFYLNGFNYLCRPAAHTWLNWTLYAAMLMSLWGLRKHPRLACFLAVSTFLFLYGNSYVLMLLLAGAMLRALWDTFRMVLPKLRLFTRQG